MRSNSKQEPQTAVAETSGRVDARYPASAVPAIKGVRLSPGDAVTLLNVSASGILVEGKTRFVPGTRVTVIFEGGITPPQVKGRVVRCQVSAIASGGALQYQTGIAFEAKITLPLEPSAEAPAPEPPPAPRASKSAPPPPAVRNRW